MNGGQQDTETSGPRVFRNVFEQGLTNNGTNALWIRRHLRDSIYVWACGEKADERDKDPTLSDSLIGWITLFVQGFAYAMLIALARTTPTSEMRTPANISVESGYLLPSVTGAMYLLIASTTHDLRAGFSLLIDGLRTGHRAFGIGLLIVYGIMISAAMTVLVSTSDDNASVVLNAVAVLFIADLDEKALQLLRTIPHNWRLFWTLQSIGISFTLSLVAVIYIGHSSSLLKGSTGALQVVPTWFVWGINPVGVTLSCLLLRSTLQAACDLWDKVRGSIDEASFGSKIQLTVAGTFAIIQRGKESFREQPCFCVVQGMWLAQGVVCWLYAHNIIGKCGFPVAFDFQQISPTSVERTFILTGDKAHLIYMNVILATGFAAKVFIFSLRKVSASRFSSQGETPRARWDRFADSRVPSLLVGWGLGYWGISTFLVLSASWHGGQWSSAPGIVRIIAYVVVPCFYITGIFMVADTDFLGTSVEAFVKPAVETMNNRARVEYWVMVTIFRDILIGWMALCRDVRYSLTH